MSLLNLDFLSHSFTVLGTAAFAVSAVLAAEHKNVDIFTVIILGIITAVGGGTMRDGMLDVPMFWSQDTSFLWVSIISSILGFIFFGLLNKRWIHSLYLHIDTIAIAMFAIQATNKAWNLGFGLPIVPMFMGLITAIGGGMIRDVLLQRPTLLFSRELYAIPVALGCGLHCIVLALAPQWAAVSALCAIAFIITLRTVSIQFNIGVPAWALLGHQFTLVKPLAGKTR